MTRLARSMSIDSTRAGLSRRSALIGLPLADKALDLEQLLPEYSALLRPMHICMRWTYG
jgi:hypothetical protein